MFSKVIFLSFFLSRNLVNKLPKFIDQASQMVSQEKYVIFIDGLDELEPSHQTQSMEWLPSSVPEVSCIGLYTL